MDWTTFITTATSFAAAALAARAITLSRKMHAFDRDDSGRVDFFAADRSAEAVLVIDAAGNIRYANLAVAGLLHDDTGRIAGQHLDKVLRLDATSDAKAAPDVMQTARGMLLTRTGGNVVVEIVRLPLPGKSKLTMLMLRDLTQQISEAQLAHDERDVLEDIAANRPLDQVIERVSAAVLKQQGGPRVAVLVRRDGAAHCHGAIPPEMRRAMERVDVSWGDSPTSWWIVPRVFDDVQADPIFSGAATSVQMSGVRTCWSFPIKSVGRADGEREEAAGVMLAFPVKQTRPTPEDTQRLERCGRLLALAMERERLSQSLATRSLVDPLTGLPNRMLTSDRLTHAINRARRGSTQLATIVIDLDGFKSLNDSLGNEMGDKLLQAVSERLKPCVRSSDTLGRMGNDQFIVLASEVATTSLSIICDRLLGSLKQPFALAGHTLTLTASVGVAVFPQDGEDTNALIRNADTAMLHAKRQCRGGYRLFEPFMSTATVERVELENQLRAAVENEEIIAFYQPQCDSMGRVVAVEALARWKRGGTLIPPVKFIPIAEETGLIVPIGTHILRLACKWARQWQNDGRDPIRVAVNVSALQFAQDDFVQIVRQTLEDAELDPRWLAVEVTESLLMTNTKNVASKLEKLRAMGVETAIDDFGTGYSSLAYLQKLPIDVLKIDRSFVKEIDAAGPDSTVDRTAVIRAILSMAHSMKLQVVAEGVETPVQWEYLRRAGCQLVQGYLFCPPKSPTDLPAAVDKLNAAAMTAQAA